MTRNSLLFKVHVADYRRMLVDAQPAARRWRAMHLMGAIQMRACGLFLRKIGRGELCAAFAEIDELERFAAVGLQDFV
jgi:hypothetical protein